MREHSIDQSAFDPSHPYYDPKSSREKPKWEVVHVEFVKKFKDIVTLKQLKSFAATDGALQDMQVIKQSRLSVSSVRPAEWRFILEQANEDPLLGMVTTNGYESDLDGEADDEDEDVVDGSTDAEVDVQTGAQLDGETSTGSPANDPLQPGETEAGERQEKGFVSSDVLQATNA